MLVYLDPPNSPFPKNILTATKYSNNRSKSISTSFNKFQSYIQKLYCLLSVVLNNYVIKQIAVKSIHKLILFIEQK